MATKILRPLLRNLDHRPPTHLQTRTFLPNPFANFNPLAAAASSGSQNQTLTATRILPYSSQPIYTIISDVPSYSAFLPYCQRSTVTEWSAPDTIYKREWPSEAEIVVGWGNITESFTSRIFCVPGKIVESVGGGTETLLDKDSIRHHLHKEGDSGGANSASGLLTHLRSQWKIDALPKEQDGSERTSVTLSLEFAFSNPLYTALSAGAIPKVADFMIKAFEERVKLLLDNDSDMAKASLGDLEGSVVKR